MTESYCTNDENEITIKIAGYDPEFGSWILKSMFPTPKELLPLIGERIVFTTPSNRPLLTKENDNAKDADSLTKLYCSVGQDLDVTVIENIYDETFVLDDDEVEANSCNQGKYTAERDEKIGDNATVAVHQSSGSLDIVDSLPSEAKLNNRPGKQDEDTNDNSNSQKKKKRRSSTDWDSLTTPLNPATTVGRRKRRVLPAVFSMATKSRQMSVQSAEGLYQGLNDEQKRIHDWIVAEKENALITGSAGTGKSVLLKAIISTVRSKYADNEVAVTASTGIAALNIDGVTVHSFASVGLAQEDVNYYVNKIKKTSSARTRWLRVKVLIIDEISMISGRLLDLLDQIARKVRLSNAPFGGIQVVFCGDFYQLPPVADHTKPNDDFAFKARCWKDLNMKVMLLKSFFRQKDFKFVRILEAIRHGELSNEIAQEIQTLSRPPTVKIDISPTELYPRKKEVEAANNKKLQELPGEVHLFRAQDTGSYTVLDNCIATFLLTLKEGAQVMLIKNLSKTLVNGSIGIVIGFETSNTGENLPKVKFNNGEERVIHRELWQFNQGDTKHTRAQIPLLLSWAMSIHKSQGQTIEYVKVDLAKAFANGQVYVALSRARCMENLQVKNFKIDSVKTNKAVKDFYAQIQAMNLQ